MIKMSINCEINYWFIEMKIQVKHNILSMSIFIKIKLLIINRINITRPWRITSMNNEVKKILAEIVKKLKKDYKPLKIILFGSHAYGQPKDDSDLDLLILKNTRRRPVDRFVNVKRIIYNPKWRIPISPLVYTPKELENRLRMGDDFISEITKKGIVLYER